MSFDGTSHPSPRGKSLFAGMSACAFLSFLLVLGGCNQTQRPATSVAPHVPLSWFEDQPVLGALPPAEMAEKLEEIGEWDSKKVNRFKAHQLPGNELYLALNGKPDVSRYTSHQFGFLKQDRGSGNLEAMQQAGAMPADTTLKGGKLRITLDRLRVAHYPGAGRHNILFTFAAQNQVTGTTEDVAFNQHYEVLEGQEAGIAGYPVFIGLNIGDQGVSFKCHTVNVSNDGDEKFLGFLKGNLFQQGMKLLNTANPVVPIVSQFAVGIAEGIASRNKNVGVQDFFMGLDFTGPPTGVRLAQGSYIAVQAPGDNWNWDDWVYDSAKGQVVAKAGGTPIPYNYIIFGVTKM
jgi:hypothetical protein